MVRQIPLGEIRDDDLQEFYDVGERESGPYYQLKESDVREGSRLPPEFYGFQRDQARQDFLAARNGLTIHGARSVRELRVVVHKPEAEFENHWSLYLILDKDTSVRLSMRAPRGSHTGKFTVTDLNYILSHSAIQYWDFPVACSTTVAEFIDLIFDNRRHEYIMPQGTEDCRFWIYVVVTNFGNKRYLDDRDAKLFMAPKLEFFYTPNDLPRPSEMIHGKFVADDDESDEEEDGGGGEPMDIDNN